MSTKIKGYIREVSSGPNRWMIIFETVPGNIVLRIQAQVTEVVHQAIKFAGTGQLVEATVGNNMKWSEFSELVEEEDK